MGDETRSAAAHERRKAPRPPDVSPRGIERAALSYLERFDSSVANLRRVLADRVRKAQLRSTEPVDRAAALKAVDELLARYCESGLLNDRRYGENLLSGLRQRGMSSRRARLKLTTKGLAESLVDELLEQEAESSEQDAELAAAIAYVRKRRLGHYRKAAVKREADGGDEMRPDASVEADSEEHAAEADTTQRAGPKAWRQLPARASAKPTPQKSGSAGGGFKRPGLKGGGFKGGGFKRAIAPEVLQRDKDLATLARRGFSFETARRALDEPPEE